jgi:hypothetical protein
MQRTGQALPMKVRQSRATQRLGWMTTLLLIVALGLAALSGCGRTVENYAALKQLQDAIKQAADSSDDATVMKKSLTMLEFKPQGEFRVWALSQIITSARNLKDDAVLTQYLPDLDVSLGQLIDEDPPANAQPNSDLARIYQGAEAALREANAYAFFRWSYGKDSSPDVLKIFQVSGDAYIKYHSDTILLSDVLWQQAEFYRVTGENMKAVPLYEQAIVKDFQSKYPKKAQEKLAEIWTEESAKTPLPTDIKEATPIPSPHKEWMEIANRRMKAGLPDPERRAIELRFAEIHYAFGDKKTAYDIYLKLATSSPDPAALDAASRYTRLVHDADTIDAFRLLRSQLSTEAAPFLWKQAPFREQLFEIGKKQLAAEPPLKEDAYKLLADLAHTNQDATSVEAAKTLLNFAATAENKFDFRLIRKDLQDDKYLWSQPTFQNLVINLKKQVEGTE